MIKKSFVYLMLLAVAAVLLLVNLYLWHLERNTQHRIADLQQQVGLHLRENKMLNDRNDALRIDVENLRSPDSYYAYEEKAREDYGMIGKNETYFVLPDSEMANIPDIPGLVEREKRRRAANTFATGVERQLPSDAQPINQKIKLESDPTATADSGKTVDPIPVSPVPLQLESLQ